MISRYVSKIDAIALLLLGGVKSEALKEWYGITDKEIQQAKEKLKKLGLR